MKRITASLCLIALLLGLASCSKEAPKESETNGTTETLTTPVEESTETEDTRLTSGLPADFDLGGKSIRVLQFHSDADILPIDVAEMTGDTLNDAIYTANQSVMDKLNCVYDFIDNEDIETTKLENTYAAGEDAYDLVIGVQWKVAPLVTKHMFANLNPSTGNYIDLDQPWWYGKYIAETEADGTHTYFLAGDASVNVFRRASMLICNMDLLENIGEDIDALYDKVLDGTWVWDDFVGLVEKVYVDNNGDGKKDGGDTYGFATWSRADGLCRLHRLPGRASGKGDSHEQCEEQAKDAAFCVRHRYLRYVYNFVIGYACVHKNYTANPAESQPFWQKKTDLRAIMTCVVIAYSRIASISLARLSSYFFSFFA